MAFMFHVTSDLMLLSCVEYPLAIAILPPLAVVSSLNSGSPHKAIIRQVCDWAVILAKDYQKIKRLGLYR